MAAYLDAPSGMKLRDWLTEKHIPLTVLHSSGHAAVADLQRFAGAIDAREVVPVHTRHGGRKVIPATPMYHRYRFFKYTSKGERRAQAEYFANKKPKELATQFGASVLHFEPYDNIAQAFIKGTLGFRP